MKFNCDKSPLKSAVATAGKVAVSKSSLPILECIMIESVSDDMISITGYDQETAITVKIDSTVYDTGKFLVKARLLSDILSKMPDDTIDIVEYNGNISIISGKAQYNVPSMDVEQYPDLPTMDGTGMISIPEYAFKSMIENTSFCVSQDSARIATMGVYFETDGNKLVAVATDGYRMAIRREEMTENPVAPLHFIVPGVSLDNVKSALSASVDPVTIAVSDSHIRISAGIVTITARRIDAEFIDYHKIIQKDFKYRINCKLDDLKDSADRVSLVANDKIKAPVKLQLNDNEIVMTAKSATGSASDICPVEGNGEGMIIGFNPKYLLDAAKNCPADNVVFAFQSPNHPAMLLPEAEEGDPFAYMVLPVRLKADD